MSLVPHPWDSYERKSRRWYDRWLQATLVLVYVALAGGVLLIVPLVEHTALGTLLMLIGAYATLFFCINRLERWARSRRLRP